MNPPDHHNASQLALAIAQYADALSALEQAFPSPTLEQIIDVLVARDAVEAIKQNAEDTTGKTLAQLILLDQRLRSQSNVLTQQAQLADCRQSLQPPESAWWWWLDPPPAQMPWWSRFDWCWNLLTVGCLVITGTFITNTAQAFSTSGFDLIGTFSTITQGAGLVLVAGGALTDKGQKVVERIWSSLKIPAWFHAEATLLVAVLLLLAAYNINRNLPQIGEFYYQQGLDAEAEDQWLVAKDQYERTLQFMPDAPRLQVGLGKIHERLGQLEAAQKHYESGVLSNDVEARIRLGRVKLLEVLQAARWTGKVAAEQQAQIRDAEIYLEMAEKRLTADRDRNYTATKQQSSQHMQTQRLLIEVYINQGILLWSKVGLESPDKLARDELLDQAEALFKQAADLEYRLPTVPTGRRADCYHKIAVYINTKVKTKNYQNRNQDIKPIREAASNCATEISYLSDHDMYDVFLMSRAMKARVAVAKSD